MKTACLAATICGCVALAACGGGQQPAPSGTNQSGAATHSASPAPTTVARPAETDLPNVHNTKVDFSDPTDVAIKFLELSSTFSPGEIFDPVKASERGYPLATEHYRRTQAPASNTQTVRIRGWWNQDTSDNDPVVRVNSEVEFLTRPSPPTASATTAMRNLRVTQTPLTSSGRALPPRVQDAQLTLLKQSDGRWLVDQGIYKEAQK